MPLGIALAAGAGWSYSAPAGRSSSGGSRRAAGIAALAGAAWPPRRGRPGPARMIESRIEAETGRPLPPPEVLAGEVEETQGSYAEIFRPPYLRRTVMLVIFQLLQTIGYCYRLHQLGSDPAAGARHQHHQVARLYLSDRPGFAGGRARRHPDRRSIRAQMADARLRWRLRCSACAFRSSAVPSGL